jgi:hypothetical protein
MVWVLTYASAFIAGLREAVRDVEFTPQLHKGILELGEGIIA